MSENNSEQLNFENFSQLREYFLGKNKIFFKEDDIGFHEIISKNMIENIMNLTEQLDLFMYDFFQNHNFDYHKNSKCGCHILSSLFCLSDPSWNLIQGEYKFQKKNDSLYHSWLEKDGIVYDPAMKLVTSKELYDQYFFSKYCYNKEELIILLKRTGTFTYYEEDIERGCVNPLGKLLYYDTKIAESATNNILDSLENYFHQKTKQMT